MTRSVARPRSLRLARPAAVLVTLLLTAPALAACSPQEIVENAAETAAENAAEGAIEGQTGQDVDVETGSLPADFPADTVPLVDGTISHAVGSGTDSGQVWIVAIEYDGTPDEAVAAATGALTAAGFAEPADMSGLGLNVLEKDGYQVMLAAADQAGVTALSYTVTQAGA